MALVKVRDRPLRAETAPAHGSSTSRPPALVCAAKERAVIALSAGV